MSLLTDDRLAVARFTPELATLFGCSPGEEGCRLIESAAQNGRSRVAVRDWLYCLAKMPGSLLCRQLIESRGKDPASFIRAIESGFDDDDFMTDLPPPRLTLACVEPGVVALLDRIEELATAAELPSINESAVALAVLETADPELREMLCLWAEEEGLQRLTKRLQRELRPEPAASAELFGSDGALRRGTFDASGLRTIQRIIDDAGSMGVKRLTTRHVLYSLLANESGLLSVALTIQGIDVRKDVHAVLVRELRRAGGPKRSDFQLTAATCYLPVVHWLECAQRLARERDAEHVAERDLHQAFAETEVREIQRLLPSDAAFHPQSFVEHVRTSAAESLEENEGATDGAATPTIKDIEAGIRSRLFGQDAAIARVIPWIKRLQFGMPRDGRPAGVFLFVGPTGTGKTQLAREIARHVYGSEDRLLFLEMGQFKTPESISMLIGAPPGYVGYGDGKLTNGLGNQPQCVVLFDEIEKAHTQVFDVILRFADEGLISDPAGPVRDGRRSIIVLTTNAGQTWLRKHLAEQPNAVDDPSELSRQLFAAAMQELTDRGFRPEFLARVDERLTFLPLTLQVCRDIVNGVLVKEFEKFQTLKKVTITATESAAQFLAQEGMTRVFDEGARAFPRVINELLVTPLIDLLADDHRVGRIPLTATVNVVRSRLVLELSP